MKSFTGIAIDSNDLDRIDNYRRKFNTSVLTILFTDIESSTKFREELGDKGYTELLEKHDSILLPLISNSDGLHIKSIGDSILAVFFQPSDAVECAIRIQDAIHNSPLIKHLLKIRIGIDMGQVAKEQSGGILKDIFGRFVNRASRIEGLAGGGHILCSESVQDNAVGWTDSAKIKWHDHGFHRVKGVEKLLRIWEPFNANITEHDTISEKNSFGNDAHAEQKPLIPCAENGFRSQTDNESSAVTSGNRKNFKGIVTGLEGIGTLFQEQKEVFIGYMGGISALQNADMNRLENRRFKWDDNLDGKIAGNWIQIDKFVEILERKGWARP